MKSAEHILETQSFKEVTFSNIAKLTKLSRPSIYKYYKFPEEILANILMIKFSEFNDSLSQMNPKNKDELSKAIVDNALNQKLMMKLLSLNFSIIEDNLRDESFLKLKEQIFSFMDIIKDKIKQMDSKVNADAINNAQYSLLTLLSAIYPITHDDGNHVNLMKTINPNFNKPDYKQLLTHNIKAILAKI